nr:Tfx family DNA-binding protein [Natrinema salifodinae]
MASYRYDRASRRHAGEGSTVIDDTDDLLAEIGFDPETSVLTHRQAQVLALRERGVSQADIADELGTSRANVSSIESSARENVEKARETVAFAEALRAPVRVRVPEGTDLYDVPQLVYEACDEAGVKVDHTAPDLMKVVSDAAGPAVTGRQVSTPLIVGVTSEGMVRVRHQDNSAAGR